MSIKHTLSSWVCVFLVLLLKRRNKTTLSPSLSLCVGNLRLSASSHFLPAFGFCWFYSMLLHQSLILYNAIYWEHWKSNETINDNSTNIDFGHVFSCCCLLPLHRSMDRQMQRGVWKHRTEYDLMANEWIHGKMSNQRLVATTLFTR